MKRRGKNWKNFYSVSSVLVKELLHESFSSLNLRDYQKESIDFLIESLKSHYGAILESPTGSGKTIMSLVSALSFARQNRMKVLYLTRTNSQQDQVISEIRKIRQFSDLKAVAVQGRTNLCPLYKEIEDEEDFNSESLSKMCSSRKKKVVDGIQSACRFYNNEVRSEETKRKILEELISPEEVYKELVPRVICPYESIKYAMRDAEVCIMPYSYFLNPHIAPSVLYNWRTSRENIVIILDEAHNLPELSRGIFSFRITLNQIGLVERECSDYADPELLPNIRSTDLCESIRNAIIDIQKERLSEVEESRIMFLDFIEYITINAKVTRANLEYMLEALNSLGDSIEEFKEKSGKVPRSHVKTFSEEIRFCMNAEDSNYIAIINKELGGTVEAYCLDPSIVLEPLKESRTVHLSGTLRPFDIYKKITGFDDLPTMSVENIFPQKNLMIGYVKGISTRHADLDKNMLLKISDQIRRLLAGVKRKMIIFFPSRNLMNQILEITGRKGLLVDSGELDQMELMKLINRFKTGEKHLFTVIGGRMSEGINLPGKLLEVVIIAGIPYPKPDVKQRTLMAYYDHLFGRGWDYAVTFPTSIRLRQTIGRLIRSFDDRGIAIILDERAEIFSPYIGNMKQIDNCEEEINQFFSDHK
ncbi:MAG: ATP-dependent DNA helicase [Thermoplasmataceae archaeon]